MTRLEATLKHLRNKRQQNSLSPLPSCDVKPTDHRREHRPSVLGIINSQPQLQAFIVARLDRLTFKQIADDIAANFPPDLHIHQSTVHRRARKRA